VPESVGVIGQPDFGKEILEKSVVGLKNAMTVSAFLGHGVQGLGGVNRGTSLEKTVLGLTSRTRHNFGEDKRHCRE